MSGVKRTRSRRKVNREPPKPWKLASRERIDLALSLYTEVRDARYKETRPKANQADIIADDDWRYETLPVELKEQESMTKDQLVRLVQWKLTHGQYRPILLGLIRKNKDEAVEKQTQAAADLVRPLDKDTSLSTIEKTVTKALDEVCKLQGVGPATGSLILNVFCPDFIPFFEDELYDWLHPGTSVKTRYDKKEYKSLFIRCLELMKKRQVTALELEKIAYVVSYPRHLGPKQRDQLRELSVADSGQRDSVSPEPFQMSITYDAESGVLTDLESGKSWGPEDKIEEEDMQPMAKRRKFEAFNKRLWRPK